MFNGPQVTNQVLVEMFDSQRRSNVYRRCLGREQRWLSVCQSDGFNSLVPFSVVNVEAFHLFSFFTFLFLIRKILWESSPPIFLKISDGRSQISFWREKKKIGPENPETKRKGFAKLKANMWKTTPGLAPILHSSSLAAWANLFAKLLQGNLRVSVLVCSSQQTKCKGCWQICKISLHWIRKANNLPIYILKFCPDGTIRNPRNLLLLSLHGAL